MSFFLKKLLFTLEPETAHALVKQAGRIAPTGLLGAITRVNHECLQTKIGNTMLKNPVGLAAGFDKNAEMLAFLTALGFGHVEIGSVTAKPCEGNPKPRVFRLTKDKSLINWMGLPNEGAEKIERRLASSKQPIPLGINIAKTPEQRQNPHIDKAIQDYLSSYRILHEHGTYITFNLSCPNSTDGETFEDPKFFERLATEIQKTRGELKCDKPHLVKISPDISERDTEKLVATALEFGFEGFVVSNTTKHRDAITGKISREQSTRGGLSGLGVKKLSDAMLARVQKLTSGKAFLIGVGGILTFADLVEKLCLGANLVQVYTGLIYSGPFFVRELNRKLVRLCGILKIKNHADLSNCRMSEIKSAVEEC